MASVRLFFALLVCVVAAELIGIVRIPLGELTIVLLPLVFAFVLGLILNPNVNARANRLLDDNAAKSAARQLPIAVMPLIAFLSAFIGPNLEEISDVGVALVLQELGNLGTMLIALPVAVVVFRMGRESVGATFSIGREGGLAFIYGRYGGDSPEATGVMAVYVCGTFLGAAFFSFLPPLIASLGWLDPRALAMACGTGSASMTGACSSALASSYPEMADQIAALAATSNLMSGLSNLFVIIFITLPLTEWLYRQLTRRRPTHG
ncbi:MAG: DUF3100 domain-containing protein [Pseudomonadota bacterium]